MANKTQTKEQKTNHKKHKRRSFNQKNCARIGSKREGIKGYPLCWGFEDGLKVCLCESL